MRRSDHRPRAFAPAPASGRGRKARAGAFGLRAICQALALLLAVGAGLLPAQNFESLRVNPPFGPAAPAADPARELEFRGVVQEGAACFVNLLDRATGSSTWVPVGGRAGDLVIKGYAGATEEVSLVQGGRALTLALKRARVNLVDLGATAPVAPGERSPAEKAEQAYIDENLAEVRALARGPLEGEGDPVRVLRHLPAEVRAVVEAGRRRRGTAGGVPAFP